MVRLQGWWGGQSGQSGQGARRGMVFRGGAWWLGWSAGCGDWRESMGCLNGILVSQEW